jgi:predicted ester cyclase
VSNRQNFVRAVQSFADPRTRQEYFRLYSDDIVLHGYQGVEPGLESVKQFYYAFWAVFPDAKVTVQELLEEVDTLVARYVITGTQQEAFMGVAAAGQQIALPGISILHFKSGRCFERWACSDSLLLMSQIGAPIQSAGKVHSEDREGGTGFSPYINPARASGL